jgi:hypothetical protein
MSYLGGISLCKNVTHRMVNELLFKLQFSYIQMAMTIMVVVFWDVIQCNLLDGYQIAEQPPRFLQNIGSHSITSQKTTVFIQFLVLRFV